MKLRNEHIKSYIDDFKDIGLLKFLTWKGKDVAFAWIGAYEPATRSDDEELNNLADSNRVHYLFYRALVEKHVERQGTILDVGCGSGQRTLMLSRYADNVAAIESDISKIGVGSFLNYNPKIQYFYSDFIHWTREVQETFDYVFAVELIEHIALDSQEDFIDKLFAKVKPGGALLMTTPKDRDINRVAPHIGLWDDTIARSLGTKVNGNLKYFSTKQLDGDGEDPWCSQEDATHYVLIAKKE